MHLIDQIQPTRVLDYQAAGTTDTLTSDRVNMAGYDGVLFIASIGTVVDTGTATMVSRQAATDISGSAHSGSSVVATTGDSDKFIAIDIKNLGDPGDQYVGVTLVRATANIVVNEIIAIQYGPRTLPVTQLNMGDTVDKLVAPAEA